MAALDTEFAAPPALADRVAMVRAQLAPIRSRRALLDSYRRESLCRLACGSMASVRQPKFSRSRTPCAGWSLKPRQPPIRWP